ncbi:MAG: GH3 auxin-responsive promoter family protein [Bacteroidetes bacterium]|nr:GH3 auxin-responsive promoter family protein [Bacteroidota bacterium]
MGIKTTIGLAWARKRAAEIHRKKQQAPEIQQKTFQSLIKTAANTAFGQEYRFDSIKTYQDFQNRVPIRDYEGAKSWFDRIYRGESSVSWPGKPLYLAKTSGTTSGAKYIPITKASIKKQILGARDTLMLYMAETGKADFLDGKMMFLSGSPEIEKNDYGLRTGRLSGIVNHFVPGYLTTNRVPGYETNCIEDWEEKVSTIVREIKNQDLRLISGIPPWVQMLFEELENQTGKRPLEVWPNLSLFVQGGVNFEPYQPIFDGYFEGKVDIAELYPASEGFFAVQETQADNGLLLMPDYGIFYEFIPLEEYGKPDPVRLTLEEVEVDKQYALIVSTNAGLWAYDIGDTVKFTSVNPWKIRVSGRVKHFISAFGEHVIAEEVNYAMLKATEATGAVFQEFTVAPLIREAKGDSAHEWLIEFVKEPDDYSRFSHILDEALRERNSYYNDLREGNILRMAEVKSLSLNASREYMKSVGRLGGQNKFPRLSNDRKVADKLYEFVVKRAL